MTTNNPVGWFEIYVQDMQRAKAFYENVFGLELTRLDGTELEMWAFPMQPERHGAPGALVRMPGFPSGAARLKSCCAIWPAATETARVWGASPV